MPASLVTIDASEPLETINEIIARDGGVIVKNFLSPDLLQECLTSIEPHFRGKGNYKATGSHNEIGADFFPEGSIRLYALLSKIPDQLTKIMRLPVWQGVMEKFLW